MINKFVADFALVKNLIKGMINIGSFEMLHKHWLM